MLIKEIFQRAIDRQIDGVIKTDEKSSIAIEFDEYVITKETTERLEIFFDNYTQRVITNSGSWISGFFGSGKSHLLKILSMVLENKLIGDRSALDIFKDKITDHFLLAKVEAASRIPSESILFNIDQKTDTITKDETDAILAVFVKAFNEHLGFYGVQPYIAKFEQDLTEQGLYENFKIKFEEVYKKPWSKGREEFLLNKKQVAIALASVKGGSEEDYKDILSNYRIDYKLSFEEFANQVQKYIDSKGDKFRLNFFVDEVGQYIANNTKLMLNLQTMAETLVTKCKGRSWVIVTAQEDMDSVLGGLTKEQGNDFSKIQARFATKLSLTSQNVSDVIIERLLKKKPDAIPSVAAIYNAYQNDLKTLFTFTNNSRTYKQFTDEDDFVKNYPFIPYQFQLFQSAIQALSANNAFQGRHASVGERSMLGVFQSVAKEIANEEVGNLATFDYMYEGIRSSIKSGVIQSISTAENNLNDEFAIRVLKSLFLVKYVKEFKPTLENICILHFDKFGQNSSALKEKVLKALTKLENETYIQRNGEVYEFLTNEEKDIETEIKNTDLEPDSISKKLHSIIFQDIIKDTKIVHISSKTPYKFTQKLDGSLLGSRESGELTIDIISPNYGSDININTLCGNCMGKPEMMVVLPQNPQMMVEIAMFLKTERYVQQKNKIANTDATRAILLAKADQNRSRGTRINEIIREAITNAKFIVSGNLIEISTSDPLSRIIDAFQDLISTSYKHLKMLKGITYKEEDIPTFLDPNRLFSVSESSDQEAQNEVLNHIKTQLSGANRVTVKMVIDHFERRPYGWQLPAILCLIAGNIGRGNLEVLRDSVSIEPKDLPNLLKNTQSQQNLYFRLMTHYTDNQIKTLKDLYFDFLGQPAEGNDAKQIANDFIKKIKLKLDDVQKLHNDIATFPFLSKLESVIPTLSELSKYSYEDFISKINDFHDKLLDIKEDYLQPIEGFMNGNGKVIFQDARDFITAHRYDMDYIDKSKFDELQTLLAAPNAYAGNNPVAIKDLHNSLHLSLLNAINSAKNQSKNKIDTLKEQFQSQPTYQVVSDSAKHEFDHQFEIAKSKLDNIDSIAAINQNTSHFEDKIFTEQLAKLFNLNQPTGGEATPKPVVIVRAKDVKPSFNKSLIDNESDLDDYLSSLKSALLNEIQSGKKVQI